MAVNNAVQFGVIVVAAEGNTPNLYYVTDSPGSAVRAISVVASDRNDGLWKFSTHGPRGTDDAPAYGVGWL